MYSIDFHTSTENTGTVYVLKFRTQFSNKMLVTEKQTGKTLIRLLLKKQSDLGLPCLSRLLWQATTVRNFRTFTIHAIKRNAQIFHF